MFTFILHLYVTIADNDVECAIKINESTQSYNNYDHNIILNIIIISKLLHVIVFIFILTAYKLRRAEYSSLFNKYSVLGRELISSSSDTFDKLYASVNNLETIRSVA